MTAHENVERLSSYLDEELDVDEARRVAEHLDGCERCRMQLEGLRRVMGDLRSLGESAPPAGLGLRIQQRLAREAPPYQDNRGVLGHQVPRPFFQPAILASLAIVLALGVIMVMFSQVFDGGSAGDFRGRGPNGPMSIAPPEAVEVAGRTFEMLGGMWVEADLTVAEVAEARLVSRAGLLAETAGDDDVLAILERMDLQITMHLDGGTVRVPAVGDASRDLE